MASALIKKIPHEESDNLWRILLISDLQEINSRPKYDENNFVQKMQIG